MTKRRNFSDKCKAAVVLLALRGDKTAQEIAATRVPFCEHPILSLRERLDAFNQCCRIRAV